MGRQGRERMRLGGGPQRPRPVQGVPDACAPDMGPGGLGLAQELPGKRLAPGGGHREQDPDPHVKIPRQEGLHQAVLWTCVTGPAPYFSDTWATLTVNPCPMLSPSALRWAAL